MRPTYVLRAMDDGPQRTILVLGAYRGGTSLAACALHRLGVWMGDFSDPGDATYECPRMRAALQARDLAQVKQIIHEGNARPVWGWKSPATLAMLPEVLPLVRNPVMISVFRDPVAVIGREIERNTPLRGSPSEYAAAQLHQLMSATHEYARVYPTLTVSCERARRDPTAFVEDLVEFLKLPAATEAKRRAAWALTGGYWAPGWG